MATFHRQNSETRAIRSHFKAWQLFILRTLKPTATKSQGPAGACLLSKVLERRLKSGASHLFLHWNSRHILRCDLYKSGNFQGKTYYCWFVPRTCLLKYPQLRVHIFHFSIWHCTLQQAKTKNPLGRSFWELLPAEYTASRRGQKLNLKNSPP